MLIRNVKSFADLEKKKNLQSQLLQIAIENEATLESRVKDYKNPNKPPPLPPQYKTSAEIMMDSNLQQKEVVNNLLSINGVDNYLALGVSQALAQLPNGVGNYVIFNKNFPVIKKRLEDISKSAYGVDTFMDKIEEVLNQIELGILYNTTGGLNPSSSFSQGIGAGGIMPSGEDVEDLKRNRIDLQSDYGSLLLKLYTMRDAPFSPLANDAEFIAVVDMVEQLCNLSPEKKYLDDVDLIEQLERQKIQREIDRLIQLNGLPSFNVIANVSQINVQDFLAQVNASQQTQNAIPDLPDSVARPYGQLIKAIKGIKNPQKTLKDLGSLKDKLERLLGGVQAVQQGLQSQLMESQKNLIDLQLQQNRKEDVVKQKALMRKVAKRRTDTKERMVSNLPHPVLKDAEGRPLELYNYFNFSPSLSGVDTSQIEDFSNFDERADLVVEVVNSVNGVDKKSFVDGNGNTLINPDNNLPFTSYTQLEEWFEDEGRPLSKYFWRNYLYIPKKGVPKLYVGNDETLKNASSLGKELKRYDEQQIRGIIMSEISQLDNLLDTDVNYAPYIQGNEAQRLIPSQGFGLSSQNRVVPAVYQPVMGSDGKMYDNKYKALLAGAGMKKPDTIHIDINSHNGEGYKMSGDGFMHRKIKIGKGIEVQEQPRYKTFGKYIIHIPYLENDNILNFKFPSMGSIPTLKPVNIDDNFKEFILDILETGKVSQKHYDSLTDAEKAHFNKVIKGAGLSNSLQFKADNKIDDKKDLKRLDILLGEINAGNDNDKVKKECKELIKRCVMNGSLPKHKGIEYLFEIE